MARDGADGIEVELEVTIFDRTGTEIDREVRDFDVPDLQPSGRLTPRLLSPEIVRVRTGRELQSAIAAGGTPAASRSFTRADRLLVRVPAFDPAGLPVRLTARLLNRSDKSVRALEAIGNAPAEEPSQFLLPLVSLPADLYQIEIVGTNDNGTTTAGVSFRVGQ
jgi:hypothetical protein